MAKKGGSKGEKRFAASGVRFQEVKGGKWTVKSVPGPFNAGNSIPLGFLLRDLLKAGRTMKEIKFLLNEGKAQVNCRVRRDYRLPVGFFDIVSVEGMEKDYRIAFDLKGRLVAREIEKKPKKSKLCRVEDKKTGKKGRIQLIANDGRSIFVKAGEFKTGDSVEIELPSQKILKTLKLENGAKAVIVGGKHAGKEGTVKEIMKATMKARKLVKIKAGTHEFQTTANNVFVVGGEK